MSKHLMQGMHTTHGRPVATVVLSNIQPGEEL